MDEESIKISDKDTLKRANHFFLGKVIFNTVLILLGAIFIAVFLRQMQAQSALNKQKESSENALAEAVLTIEQNNETAETLTEIFHDANQDVLDDLVQLFSSGMFDSLGDMDNKERSVIFADLVNRAGVQYLFLMSEDGRIVLSPEPALYGINPAAGAYMTQDNINGLLKGTSDKKGHATPVQVANVYGSFFFYSEPYKYSGRTYYLVLGIDDSVLDVQIDSLKDVSVVLSRAAVANDGFLFAVDKSDNSFLFFKHGDEVLTGQSAYYLGLSEDALKDGYSGIQNINGIKYYCVSKDLGDHVLISAAAETGKIYARDKYVLFWSILGFSIIMIICLVYAVIVRNDFVRHSVSTQRVTLNHNSDNPIFFDKSVFRKIFPLMLAGVLVMFGISFYTQTLLEISEGIETSHVALDEVSGRYNESLVNHDVIENYYNERFLAKAKLIAFLLEENPEVLNAESDLYHSYYDKDGNKKFITDDEGNRLKSVSSSARLQELCDANDIQAVYIFDEDGRTIATNTPNWFFTISRNEEDQSYPFCSILDGKSDSLIQEPMTNEVGEQSQLIGVTFNYFTRKTEDGKTEYISRFEYDREKDTANSAGTTEGGITAHKAMVQIQLDPAVTEKLLDSTDVATILSTNMLSDGFIVMFDATDEHKCVYSPKEASIGKTADELGVSPSAFSGFDYFGFTKVNGVKYFQFFTYADGYYVATALPRDNMYKARTLIALITSLMCFILTLILSCTVTLTSKEEEDLYESMSDKQAARGRNRSFFELVLPSGRTAVTTTAAARWDNRRIPWHERSPEQKLITMLSFVAGLLIVYILLVVLGADSIFQENSIIRYILHGGWDRGFNIFAFSSCAIVLLSISLVVSVFHIPVRIISSLLGARGETIGHLMLSVIKYGGVIGGFFYCLYLCGIDSSKLLASAGILSLVIGFGAQTLIKDILAGIFIVFEGEFRVGDIVTIGTYRGTVMDIGLRTTKILGVDGNIKIFNNSEISGVLNMTQEASYSLTYVSIEYGQDIEYVEEVLRRELPHIPKDNPAIMEEPVLLGVVELADSGVKLLIQAKCNEKDIGGVRRYMNREILKIFYKYNINVPFNNITFSPLETEGRKTLEDLLSRDKDNAEGDYCEVDGSTSD